MAHRPPVSKVSISRQTVGHCKGWLTTAEDGYTQHSPTMYQYMFPKVSLQLTFSSTTPEERPDLMRRCVFHSLWAVHCYKICCSPTSPANSFVIFFLTLSFCDSRTPVSQRLCFTHTYAVTIPGSCLPLHVTGVEVVAECCGECCCSSCSWRPGHVLLRLNAWWWSSDPSTVNFRSISTHLHTYSLYLHELTGYYTSQRQQSRPYTHTHSIQGSSTLLKWRGNTAAWKKILL